MRVWKFNTDLIEARDRVPRWCEAMSRNNLPVKKVLNADRFRGSIMARESTLGLRTTIVQADAQIIEGEYGNPSNSIWLSMLIEGSAILKSDDWSISLKPRDIIYGRTGGAHASILYEKPFRQIFLVVPQLIIDPRLLGPVKLSVGCIRAQTGISRIYSKMLLKVADGFEGLRTEELRTIELSMTEFLISCVLAQGMALLLPAQPQTGPRTLTTFAKPSKHILGMSRSTQDTLRNWKAFRCAIYKNSSQHPATHLPDTSGRDGWKDAAQI